MTHRVYMNKTLIRILIIFAKKSMQVIAGFVAACSISISFAAMDTKSLHDQGIEAFNTGNYGSAELLFRKIVNSRDEEYLDRAWFYLARSIFSKGKYEQALFEFKNFLNKCKNDTLSAESRFWMGECYYNLSDYPNAIEEFRRYISVAGKTDLAQTAHDRIGMIYLSQKRYDEAVIEWEMALSKSTDQKQNQLRHYWIGDALYRGGKYDEAMLKLAPIKNVMIEPRLNAMADLVMGRVYQKKGEHKKAIQMFDLIPAAYLKEVSFVDVLYFKAQSHIKLGQKTQARSLLESFITGAKESRLYRNAQYELGGILIEGTDFDEGLRLLDEVRTGSNKPSLKSRAALKLGRYYADRIPEKSIPYLEEALKTSRQEARKDLLQFIGKTSFRAKKYDKTIDYFNLYLKENPFDTARDEINFLLARAYLEKGEIDKATAIFEANSKENPFSKYIAESNYYMALVRYKQGHAARAVFLLGEYLKQKNGEMLYEAHVLLVRILLDKEDLDNAGKVVDIITREYMNRKDVETVLYDYATALMKKGRDARRFVNLILNRYPASESAAEIYMVLGNDSFNRNRYNAALEYFNNYLRSPYTKNRGNAFYKMLVSLYSLKRYEDVIAAIKKGNFPSLSEFQWKEIPLIQARSYYAMEKYEDVYMNLDAKIIRNSSREDILMYIRCALIAGDYRSALEVSEFLENDKKAFSESLYIIGDYLLHNDHHEEAELNFMRIVNECPGTFYVDHARLSLGELQLMEKKYAEAMNSLASVGDSSDKTIQTRKISLIIRCYFEMGKIDNALSLAETYLQNLLDSEYGEQVLLDMVRYYYKKQDLPRFERYSKLMARYRGNEAELNYLSGKFYFQTGNYHNAYNYFQALARMKSPHQDEGQFYMGLYALLVSRNAGNALTIFTKILESKDSSETIKRKSFIQSAIIYREMNNNEKARECLKKILEVPHRAQTYIQAINLYQEFGYNEK